VGKGSGGFGKLYEADALELAEMLSQINGRSRLQRTRMALFCYSRLNGSADVPYFQCGYRSIAEACEAKKSAVARFMQQMEDDGWIVTLGNVEKGKTPRRAFAWMAESVPHDGDTPSRLSGTPCPANGGSSDTPVSRNQPPSGTHQNTEYSEGADCVAPVSDEPARLVAEPVIQPLVTLVSHIHRPGGDDSDADGDSV
jgi:hypothetical protein